MDKLIIDAIKNDRKNWGISDNEQIKREGIYTLMKGVDKIEVDEAISNLSKDGFLQWNDFGWFDINPKLFETNL